jgi:hypothetical protein
MSSLYYSGDTRTNQGTSLRRPFDARRHAQIRSDVLRQAAEDLANEQAQVERRDPLSRDTRFSRSSRDHSLKQVCAEMKVIYHICATCLTCTVQPPFP